MNVQILQFDCLKDDYNICHDFAHIWTSMHDACHLDFVDFTINCSYIFKDSKLCILKPYRGWKYVSDLVGHFGWDKTITLVLDQSLTMHGMCFFYNYFQCHTCHVAKATILNIDLYTSLPIPH